MMKIAFAVAIAAAVLTPAPLLVGTIPAEAQTLRMAQGVDVQIGRDRDRPRRNDFRCHCWHRIRRRHCRPTAKLPHGDHDSRTGRWALNHAQRAPLRLNDTGRTEMASASGPFRRPLPSALTSTIFSSLTRPVVFSWFCFILWSVCRRAFLRLSDFVARESHSHFGLFTAVASVRAMGQTDLPARCSAEVGLCLWNEAVERNVKPDEIITNELGIFVVDVVNSIQMGRAARATRLETSSPSPGSSKVARSTAWDDLGEWGRQRYDARARRRTLSP